MKLLYKIYEWFGFQHPEEIKTEVLLNIYIKRADGTVEHIKPYVRASPIEKFLFHIGKKNLTRGI